MRNSHQAYFFFLRGLFIATAGAAAFLRRRRAFLRAGAFLVALRAAFFLRAGLRFAVLLRAAFFLRAGLRFAVLRAVDLRAAFFRPPALRRAGRFIALFFGILSHLPSPVR